MSFKRFLIWSYGDPPVLWSGTIYEILKEGIIGNIHVKLYEIWTSGLRTEGRHTKTDHNQNVST